MQSTPATEDDLYEWVEVNERARGKSWADVGPLTLDLLSDAIRQQHPHLPDIRQDRTICSLPTTLTLQLCSLGSTELLWLVSGLQHLDLSNNSLTKLEGISDLTHLRHLNVSHNQIVQLDGLNKLSKLEVLSVQGNKINSVSEEHLRGLDSLRVLNLSNNQLTCDNELQSFRVLPQLRALNLKDNPVCKGETQMPLVIALLPQLVYLDGTRIMAHCKERTSDLHKGKVDEVISREEAAKSSAAAILERETAITLHQMAGVLALDDGSIFKRMLEGDIEARVLLRLPGADKLLTRYRDQVGCVCVSVFKTGLEHHRLRQHELSLLNGSLDEAYLEANDTAKLRVLELSKKIDASLEQIKSIENEELSSTGDNQEQLRDKLKRAEKVKERAEDTLEEYAYTLLEEEIILADQVMEVVQRAESELAGMVQSFLSTAAEEFREARTLAYTFYCKLRHLTTKFAGSPAVLSLFTSPFESDENQFDEDLKSEGKPSSESLQAAAARVFEGEDSLSVSLGALHDRHLLCITQREMELQSHLQGWLETTIKVYHKNEWRRHRGRVQELNELLERHRDALHQALVPIVQLLDG